MIKKVKIAECEAEVVENGVPKVLTKRVQVLEKKTEVIDSNLDKPEVLDVKEHEENYVDMKFIEDEILKDTSDEIEVKDVDSDQVLENESKVVDESLNGNNYVSADKTDENCANVNDEYKDDVNIKAATKVIHDTERDLHQKLEHKQQLGGDVGNDDVVKGIAALIVPFLQAILAMVVFGVKMLQDQSETLSNLSQPSMSSSSPHCSCLTQSRMCCKVTTAITGKVASMAHLATTARLCYGQVSSAVDCLKGNVILYISDFFTDEDLAKRLLDKKHSRKSDS